MNPDAARKLALELMATHLDGSWSFHFSRSVREFGRCNYNTKRIVLSLPLAELNDEPQVRDCILHEIAHALTPASEPAHGLAWMRNCREVGANPVARYDTAVVATPPSRFIGRCDSGCKVGRQRLTPNVAGFSRCRAHEEHIIWTDTKTGQRVTFETQMAKVAARRNRRRR